MEHVMEKELGCYSQSLIHQNRICFLQCCSRLTAQSRTGQLPGGAVVARQLLLHPMTARQPQEPLQGKGTFIPFSHVKGTGRLTGLLALVPAIQRLRSKCLRVWPCNLMRRSGTSGESPTCPPPRFPVRHSWLA